MGGWTFACQTLVRDTREALLFVITGKALLIVIPAQAGIHILTTAKWIHAFAGMMTIGAVRRDYGTAHVLRLSRQCATGPATGSAMFCR